MPLSLGLSLLVRQALAAHAPAPDEAVGSSVSRASAVSAARVETTLAAGATLVEAGGPTPTHIASKEPATPKLTGAPGQGLTVDTGDGFSFNAKSRIQIRYQLDIPRQDAQGQREPVQTVNIGTARLWFGGHVYTPQLTYQIQLAVAGRDFRDGATSPLFDAYLDWKLHRDLSVRLGQYFVPFDRLRTVREWALQLGDRPRPVAEFTLDRDVGLMLYSNTFLGRESPLAWRVGLFGGGGTNLSAGKEPGALLVGRLELRPLGPIDDDVEGDQERRVAPALALGASLATNRNTNRLRSTTGPTFVGGTVDTLHSAVDLVFKWRGIALQAEHLWSSAADDQIHSTDAEGAPLVEFTRSGRGWVLQGSYTFDPPFEIVARLARVVASQDTDPAFVDEAARRGREVATGVNYYFNGHRMKLQADWIARMTDFDAVDDFDALDQVAHLQLDATF